MTKEESRLVKELQSRLDAEVRNRQSELDDAKLKFSELRAKHASASAEEKIKHEEDMRARERER